MKEPKTIEDVNIDKADKTLLEYVWHYSHIQDSYNIVYTKSITPYPVNDDRFPTEKYPVVFTTPNHWDNCVYGNIGFKVKWNPSENTKFYWVGFIDQSKDTKYRILVTENSKFRDCFDRYYPENKRGPLWLEEDKWYYNSKSSIKAEILFDNEIKLDDWLGIDFVNHNSCIQDGGGCNEIRTGYADAGSRFLSFILAEDITYIKQLISPINGTNMITALYRIEQYFGEEKERFSFTREEQMAIFKAGLFLLRDNSLDDAYILFRLLGKETGKNLLMSITNDLYKKNKKPNKRSNKALARAKVNPRPWD